MYQKYLIVASKKDLAGINITTHLAQYRKNPVLASMSEGPSFDFYFIDTEIIDDSGFDLEKIKRYDFIIFASKHVSRENEKTLSVHAPGNWRRVTSRDMEEDWTSGVRREADYGGEQGKVCPTSAQFQKQLFEKLDSYAEKHFLKNHYKVTLEPTHHGPLINRPCVFIEIGSTENEWKDNRAGFVIAKAINDTIKNFTPNPYYEIAVGIGGSHYCPNFNNIQLKSNFALSHIIPSYALPIDENMIKQAIKKTHEEVDWVLLDWKGLGNSDIRQQTTDVLDSLHINYKRTSEVEK